MLAGMDWVFRADKGWDYSRQRPSQRARRLRRYTFDLIEPGRPGGTTFGWTLTMRRAHRGEEGYAESMGAPRGAWLTFFDASAYVCRGDGRYDEGTTRPFRAPDRLAHLYGWIHVSSGRVFIRDEDLRRGFDLVILFEQEMLPRARQHPPFVRAR